MAQSVQTRLRKACFGPSYDHPSVRHSFGVDSTHNGCCALGARSRAYADASGNPIGAAAEAIDRDGDASTATWSTCMGSQACSYYGERFGDARLRFATSEDLTRVAPYVPPTVACEATDSPAVPRRRATRPQRGASG